MPIYVYKCEDCGTKYEVLHKTKEIAENIVCPSCASLKSKKMITAASVSVGGSSMNLPQMPSCASGGCMDGSCGLN